MSPCLPRSLSRCLLCLLTARKDDGKEEPEEEDDEDDFDDSYSLILPTGPDRRATEQTNRQQISDEDQ